MEILEVVRGVLAVRQHKLVAALSSVVLLAAVLLFGRLAGPEFSWFAVMMGALVLLLPTIFLLAMGTLGFPTWDEVDFQRRLRLAGRGPGAWSEKWVVVRELCHREARQAQRRLAAVAMVSLVQNGLIVVGVVVGSVVWVAVSVFG